MSVLLALQGGVAGTPTILPPPSNPLGATYPRGILNFVSPLDLLLLSQDSFFGAPGLSPTYSYPNPLVAGRPVTLGTTSSLQLNLLSTDTFYGASGQPPSFGAFTPPPGPTFPSFLRGFLDSSRPRLKDTFFGGAGQPPANLDWPLTRVIPFPSTLRGHLDPLKVNLLGQDTFFGAPGQRTPPDLPNPKGAAKPVDLLSWWQNLLQSTLNVIPPFPFSLIDWPNPLTPQVPRSILLFLGPTNLSLIGQDTFFAEAGRGPSYDYPLAKGRPSTQGLDAWVQILLQGTLSFIPTPFSFSDYPNPRASLYASDLRTFLHPVPLELLSQDTFFGPPGKGPVNLEFPNPPPKLFTISLRTFLDTLKLNLQGQDTFFGGAGTPLLNLQWPVPKGAIFAIDLRTQTVDLLQTTLAPAPPTPTGGPDLIFLDGRMAKRLTGIIYVWLT